MLPSNKVLPFGSSELRATDIKFLSTADSVRNYAVEGKRNHIQFFF